MVYSTDAAKWKAYEFSDPFAAGSFYVCNKINKFFCRPDCDARPITNLKSEIKFVESASDAIHLGYIPCDACDPLSSPSIDVSLLIKCVAHINKQIGFLPPLLDVNEERNNQRIKANIIESKRVNEEQILKTINNAGGVTANSTRRSSVPMINLDGKFSKDTTALSKNDSDHYRLVDLACRHLALAAAMSIYQMSQKSPSTPEEGNSPASPSSNKRRRKRGGVLGFKELAAKSKLSAWHFHRVFKSVTGLTPKTYGDKCWEFIKKFKDSGKYTSFSSSPDSVASRPIAQMKTPSVGYQTPSSSIHSLNESVSPEFSEPSFKRVKLESPGLISPSSKPNYNTHINNLNSDHQAQEQPTFEFQQPLFNNNFNMFESQLNSNYSRAFSAPDLTKFNREIPTSLFEHTQRLEPQVKQEPQPAHFGISDSNTSPLVSSISPTVDEVNTLIYNDFSQGNNMEDFSNLMVDFDNNSHSANMPLDYNFAASNNLGQMGLEMNDFSNIQGTGYGFNARNNDNGLSELLATTVSDL